ncbi:acetamidase [Listeria newyorkensis]|uniref:Acetamidase n=1 Tax=Listeria newyorkensis TaxID=1497681 RepID=A0A841YZF3_9LIST|nr:acetamidase/formamidase family protein [Listeria newyorkensis]KMT62048.1 Acetamidase [Listeria newyorkensis]MBC1459311.1 acetamidase/formamidase family protein [Listeria newyorkensis]PNP92079.1 acetamidase [Listeria newyorkensis]WAO23132.1 acetamidase/formamidase family protein [Listeria newyorkensis]SQC54857.1 Formamidase [Listeria newyorkensis]
MHPMTKQHVIYAMDKNAEPSMTVDNGAVVTIETYDCFENQIKSEHQPFHRLDWNRVNPATGPIFIKDAEPGDILAVTIEKIQLIGDATMLTGPDLGVLGDDLTENTIRQFPIVNNKLIFSKEITVPINKMIGVIGTAPAGEPISCGTPDAHGGNMDCKEITEGVTLFLPVNVSGALLALGDVHAAMADGEVSVSGAEIASQITMRLQIVKNKNWPTPSLISDEKIITIASAPTLDEASLIATKNMVQLLTDATKTTQAEAIMLLSLAGDLRICQVVDPNKTVRMELPLQYWSENPFL